MYFLDANFWLVFFSKDPVCTAACFWWRYSTISTDWTRYVGGLLYSSE